MSKNEKTENQLLRQEIEKGIASNLNNSVNDALNLALAEGVILNTAVEAGEITRADADLITSMILQSLEDEFLEAETEAIVEESVIELISEAVKKGEGRLLRKAIDVSIIEELDATIEATIADADKQEELIDSAVEGGILSVEKAKALSDLIIKNMEEKMAEAIAASAIEKAVVEAVAQTIKKNREINKV